MTLQLKRLIYLTRPANLLKANCIPAVPLGPELVNNIDEHVLR